MGNDTLSDEDLDTTSLKLHTLQTLGNDMKLMVRELPRIYVLSYV
jgi:hypothetical protein